MMRLMLSFVFLIACTASTFVTVTAQSSSSVFYIRRSGGGDKYLTAPFGWEDNFGRAWWSNLNQVPSTDNANRKFQWIPQGGNMGQIKSIGTQKCLTAWDTEQGVTMDNCLSLADNDPEASEAYPRQLWFIETPASEKGMEWSSISGGASFTSSCWIRFRNPHINKCLAQSNTLSGLFTSMYNCIDDPRSIIDTSQRLAVLSVAAVENPPSPPPAVPSYTDNDFVIQWVKNGDHHLRASPGRLLHTSYYSSSLGVAPQDVQKFSYSSTTEQLKVFSTSQCIEAIDGRFIQENNRVYSTYRVTVTDCDSLKPAQRFLLRSIPNSDNMVRIESKSFGNKCFDVPMGWLNWGLNILLWDCNDSNINQQFRLIRLSTLPTASRASVDSCPLGPLPPISAGDDSSTSTGAIIQWMKDGATDHILTASPNGVLATSEYRQGGTIVPTANQRFIWSGNQIKLFGTNQCIDVLNNELLNAILVQLSPCVANAPQQQFKQRVIGDSKYLIEMNGGGKCLDVLDGISAFGLTMQIWDCDNNNQNQMFRFPSINWSPSSSNSNSNPSSPFGIQWKGDLNRFIDIEAGRNTDGTSVRMWDPMDGKGGPGTAQLFEWVNGDQLRWFGTNKCLDVSGGRNNNGNLIQLWTCDPRNNNQKWVKQNDNIQWKGTDKCMNVRGGQSEPRGALLQIYLCAWGYRDEIFSIPPPSPSFRIVLESNPNRVIAGSGYYDAATVSLYQRSGSNDSPNLQYFEWFNGDQLRVVGTDLCLDVSGGVNAIGTPLQLYGCDNYNGQINQKFVINGKQIQWKGGDQNKCLSINGPAGPRIQLDGCNNGTNNNNRMFLLSSS